MALCSAMHQMANLGNAAENHPQPAHAVDASPSVYVCGARTMMLVHDKSDHHLNSERLVTPGCSVCVEHLRCIHCACILLPPALWEDCGQQVYWWRLQQSVCCSLH